MVQNIAIKIPDQLKEEESHTRRPKIYCSKVNIILLQSSKADVGNGPNVLTKKFTNGALRHSNLYSSENVDICREKRQMSL